IVDVPTVCGMCPVGCNVNATTREGNVKRILSRNHPEVDDGWLCDKGRFSYAHLHAEDRVRDPIMRVRRRGFEEVSWERALDEAERLLRESDGRIVTALSGSETVEQAYALGKLLRRVLGAHTAFFPAEMLDALGAFSLPDTANGRGVCDAWSCADDAESGTPDPIGLLIVSGDEAAANPDVRALAEKAERVIVISMFQGLAAGWADLVLPGTSYLERDGTMMNLEGRLQRLRRAVPPPAPDELAWLAKLAQRLGVELSPYAAAVFAEVSERIFGGVPFGEVGETAPLGPRAELNGGAPGFADEPPLPGVANEHAGDLGLLVEVRKA